MLSISSNKIFERDNQRRVHHHHKILKQIQHKENYLNKSFSIS